MNFYDRMGRGYQSDGFHSIETLPTWRDRISLALVDPEVMIPATHPLRAIKRFAEVALADLSSLFDQMYSEIGRPSI